MTTPGKNGSAVVYKWAFGVAFGMLMLFGVSLVGVFYSHVRATEPALALIQSDLKRIETIQWALLKTLSPEAAAQLLMNAEGLP